MKEKLESVVWLLANDDPTRLNFDCGNYYLYFKDDHLFGQTVFNSTHHRFPYEIDEENSILTYDPRERYHSTPKPIMRFSVEIDERLKIMKWENIETGRKHTFVGHRRNKGLGQFRANAFTRRERMLLDAE